MCDICTEVYWLYTNAYSSAFVYLKKINDAIGLESEMNVQKGKFLVLETKYAKWPSKIQAERAGLVIQIKFRHRDSLKALYTHRDTNTPIEVVRRG